MRSAFWLKVLPAVSSFSLSSYYSISKHRIQSEETQPTTADNINNNMNNNNDDNPQKPFSWQKINEILSVNENVTRVGYNGISYYTENQYSANNPIEDRFAIRTKLNTQSLCGSIFAVYDGHSGTHCAHFCDQELLNFIEYTSAKRLEKPENQRLAIISDELECLSTKYYSEYLKYICSSKMLPLTRAFLLADASFLSSVIVDESVKHYGNTGSCAVVSHINVHNTSNSSCGASQKSQPQPHNHHTNNDNGNGDGNADVNGGGVWITTAWVGDCRAIVGRKVYDVNRRRLLFDAVELTRDHQIDLNAKEKHRLLSEHPTEHNVIKRNRVKGRLQPTRVFGDGHYKRMDFFENWKNCHKYETWTPPYVTAKPDISCYRLHQNDAFMILASDGLFQDLSSKQVTEMVGQFLENRRKTDQNSNHNCIENPSTFLIEKALFAASQYSFGNMSGTRNDNDNDNDNDSDRETMNTTEILQLPAGAKRSIHDDITVLVVVFDHGLLFENEAALHSEQNPIQIPVRLQTLLAQNVTSKL